METEASQTPEQEPERKRKKRGKRARKRDKRELEELFDDDFVLADGAGLDELNNKETGDLGEAIAAAYLRQLGYEIVERNYRCPEGEADLIAYDELDDALVLVEVKTRRIRSRSDGRYPEEAVDGRKARRYQRIASCYAMEHFPVPSIRFDVMGIELVPGCPAGISHFCRAFEWDVD